MSKKENIVSFVAGGTIIIGGIVLVVHHNPIALITTPLGLLVAGLFALGGFWVWLGSGSRCKTYKASQKKD